MKKFGFTLSEVIVTLGVIGIVAAITSPLLTGIIPDKKKLLVLKVYKTVTDKTQTMLNDPGLYFKGNDCTGLDCTDAPLRGVKLYSQFALGETKFAVILANELEIDTETASFSKTPSSCSFDTLDGIHWQFTEARKFYVDIDGGNIGGNNCAYSSTCKKPDRFSFEVDKYGYVKGTDKLTKAFLNNPHKLNNKKADYDTADTMTD